MHLVQDYNVFRQDFAQVKVLRFRVLFVPFISTYFIGLYFECSVDHFSSLSLFEDIIHM